MRIWFDADNAPHVLVMKPLAEELVRRGHEVFFTARDRSSTCGLLDLYGFSYVKVGGGSVRGMAGKVLGTLRRGLYLARVGKRWRPDVSFGHGSRALPVASRLIGVPSVTMYDYEWVSPAIFNLLCSAILLPEAIGPERAREAGIDVEKARFFPGLKEEIYLSDWLPGQADDAGLGLAGGKPFVLIRPPATTAHYHNARSESVYDALLCNLLDRRDLRIVIFPRTGNDPVTDRAISGGAIVPDRALDGPGVIWSARFVAGGGGTMTREASVLGVPSASFFKGRLGRVDEHLAALGRLILLEDEEAASKLDPLAYERSNRMERREDIASRVADLMIECARS